MSMSWEHTCKKCGKNFDSFSPRHPLCSKCEVTVKLVDIPDETMLKCTNSGGYEYTWIPVRFLKIVLKGTGYYEEIPTNDDGFKVVLELDEIEKLEVLMNQNLSINFRPEQTRGKDFKPSNEPNWLISL